MASGHMNRVKRPDTWLHRPMLQNVKKVLANPEPSTHGTKRGATCTRAVPSAYLAQRVPGPEPSYRQILVTAWPVRRRRFWADGQSVWR
jgi:hypothetical protein